MRLCWMLLLVGCADEMSLELLRVEPAPAPDLVGIDSDRAGGFWLAYRTPPVGYDDLADVRVVHADGGGATVAEFRYRDTYTRVNGLAFTGDAVWLNYNGSSTDDNRIRKLDPVTGVELASFATEVGIVDLCSRDGELLLSNVWNKVAAIDLTRGGELWSAEISAFADGGTQRGIAANDDGIWVIEQESDQIALVDEEGAVLASATLPGHSDTYDDVTDHMTWQGDRLVLEHHGKLLWFQVTR